MEWKDLTTGGGEEVYWSDAKIGVFHVALFRLNSKWAMQSRPITFNRILAATDLGRAKTEAAAIVRVALEEALAALVGE